MEITLNKYSNGKIYKIINNIDNICYVGATCQTLKERLYEHTRHYKTWLTNNKGYYSSFTLFNIYTIDACKIELIEIRMVPYLFIRPFR